MRIAFAITEYFPYGGAQKDFFSIAEAMEKRGHQISVITLRWHGDKPRSWQINELGKRGSFSNHARINALSKHVSTLKSQGVFDLIIGFTRLAGLDVYFAADPCFRANRYGGIKKLLPRYRVYADIEQNLFANQNLKTFFLTQYQQQQYADSYQLALENSVVLPVCVDPAFHYTEQKLTQARAWRVEQKSDSDKALLLFVAADFNTKGLDRVIAALGLLSENQQQHFELWIVGTGKQEPYLPLLNRLSLTYQFWGGQSDLASFYFAADVLVHPARKEAAGMVLAEASAARLPMIVTDICGYAFLADEVINEKQATEQLSAKLRELNVLKKSVRSPENEKVSAENRAEICADYIESWFHDA